MDFAVIWQVYALKRTYLFGTRLEHRASAETLAYAGETVVGDMGGGEWGGGLRVWGQINIRTELVHKIYSNAMIIFLLFLRGFGSMKSEGLLPYPN